MWSMADKRSERIDTNFQFYSNMVDASEQTTQSEKWWFIGKSFDMYQRCDESEIDDLILDDKSESWFIYR